MTIDPSQYSDSVWTRAVKDRDAEVQRLNERIQVLKDKVEAGRVELRQQWERMQTENLALKAEIERLTRELREEREAFLSRQLHDTALITELCDAMEAKTSCVEDADIALIQRGREATR